MSDEKEIKEVVREERRSEKTGKYKPLPRNKQTETGASDAARGLLIRIAQGPAVRYVFVLCLENI